MAAQRTQAEIEHAALIGALQQTRAWQAVEAEVERKAMRVREFLLMTVLDEGNTAPQRDIDFARGQLSALRWVLGLPKRQEESYERSVGGNQ